MYPKWVQSDPRTRGGKQCKHSLFYVLHNGAYFCADHLFRIRSYYAQGHIE